MDDVTQIYNDNKLLVRAMDIPRLQRIENGLAYDCTTWTDEFNFMKNGTLSSASTTLVIPNVGVSTYKNIGFLINSDFANCFHIAKSDSCSNGDISRGDFHANEPDFTSIEELANYIIENNSTTMNEVNIITTIDSVVGLFINKCQNQNRSLAMIYIVQQVLKQMLGIEYPIYVYDLNNGIIEKIEITPELEEEIKSNLRTKNFYYWPEEYPEPVIDSLDNLKNKSL